MRHLFMLKRSSFLTFKWQTCFAIVLLPLVSGCSHFTGSLCDLGAPMARMKGECRDERRARSAAKEIWNCKYEQCYINHCDPAGLRKGFIDGFVDASFGKTDCPPMFAPVSTGLFLHPKTTCSMAWHNGYPMGQAAALSSGYQRNCCSRLHPCLRNYERPVNPGCVKIDDYQGSQQQHYSPGIPMEVIPAPVAPTMPPVEMSDAESPIQSLETDSNTAASEVAHTNSHGSSPDEMLVSFMNLPLQQPGLQDVQLADPMPTNRIAGMIEDSNKTLAVTEEEVVPAPSIDVETVVENNVEAEVEPAAINHWHSVPRTRSALGKLSTTFNWQSSLNP